MILADTTLEAIKRVTGTMPNTSGDFSACFWVRPVGTIPGAATYRTIFLLQDAGYVNYIWFGQQDDGHFNLYCVDGSNPDVNIDATADGSNTYDKDYHVGIVYTAATTTIELFINGVSIGSGTLDASLITATQLWMMDDNGGGWSNIAIWYARIWERKLSTAEIISEMSSTSIVQTNDVFMNTPLTDNRLDFSGNGYDWTEVGTVTYYTNPPVNQYPISAKTVNSLPFTDSLNVYSTLGYTAAVWYKYTPITTRTIGVWGFGDLTNYKPKWEVYNDAGSNIYIGQQSGTTYRNKPFLLPLFGSNTYYFFFFIAAIDTPYDPSVLSLNIQDEPNQPIAQGDFLTTREVDSDYEFPLTILAGASDFNVKRYIQIEDTTLSNNTVRGTSGLPHGQTGAIFDNGKFVLSDELTGLVKIFDSNFNLVISISDYTTYNIFPIIGKSETEQYFYLAMQQVGGGNFSVSKRDLNGNELDSWTLTSITSLAWIAVNSDGSILYFNQGGTTNIKRWDLVNDIALSDIVADTTGYRTEGLMVLDDDTILAVWHQEAGTPREVYVKQYDSTGTVLNTYDFGALWRSDFNPPTIGFALDSPNSFWISLKPESDYGYVYFKNIKVSDGSVLSTIQHAAYNSPEFGAYIGTATATPPARFGSEKYSSLLVMPLSVGRNNYSGLYSIVPNQRKDQLVNASGNNVDLAIPNPFVEGALLPPTED